MGLDFSAINYLKDPDVEVLQQDHQGFLLSLSAPTVIDISAPDSDHWYVITTLLHGNEPSGLIAMHSWLLTKPIPTVNMRFIVCSVEAASTLPLFTHRFLPQGKDMNRCFNSEQRQGYYLRAHLIERAIREVSPQLVVDMHNTSGSSPAFCVSTHMNKQHVKLASFFCDSLILSHIALGAVMEINIDCPIITLECGGSHDIQANKVAYDAISLLADGIDLTSSHKQTIKIIHHPMRLQLDADIALAYEQSDQGYSGVTLIKAIENFNYGVCRAGQILGWVDNHGLKNLVLVDEHNNNVIDDYFYFEENKLVAACDFQIFMATSVPEIAKTDCLMYLTS